MRCPHCGVEVTDANRLAHDFGTLCPGNSKGPHPRKYEQQLYLDEPEKMKPWQRKLVIMLPAWMSNGWVTLRVSVGDWVIQLGHRIAGDPMCMVKGCKNRREPNLFVFCFKHESHYRAGAPLLEKSDFAKVRKEEGT